jgi:hypothetical protein
MDRSQRRRVMRCIGLILVTMLYSGASLAQDCEIPADYTNRVYIVESDTLLVSLATNSEVYSPEDTVRIWLILENIGTTEILEMFSCNPFASVRAYAAGCDTIGEPDCTAVWSPFTFCFFDGDEEPGLAAGDCIGLYQEWRISKSGELDDGEYNVIGVFRYTCTTCSPRVSRYIPEVGARVTIVIDSSILPVTSASWGRIKALYR